MPISLAALPSPKGRELGRLSTHGRSSPHLGETDLTAAQMSSSNWSPEQAWLEGCRAHGAQSLHYRGRLRVGLPIPTAQGSRPTSTSGPLGPLLFSIYIHL